MTARRIAACLPALLLAAFFAAGCAPAATAAANETAYPGSRDLSKDFDLKLYTDKMEYSADEPIKIWATLEYVGKESQIEIWHADPYISFSITDGKKFNTGDMFIQTLSNTTLEKGRVYTFDYQKTGGFDADAPDAAFWQKFYSQKELYLPRGKYTVKVSGAFSLSKAASDQNNGLVQKVVITVR